MAYFNAGNVFNEWDLNPLAAATGIPRDTLALDRDAFLQPLMYKYRQLAAQQGFYADQGDQVLWGDPAFQTFVQTGQTPPPGYRISAPAAAAALAPPPPTAATVQQTASTIHAAATIGPAAFALGPTGAPVAAALGAPAGGFDVTSLLLLAAVAYGGWYLLTHHKG